MKRHVVSLFVIGVVLIASFLRADAKPSYAANTPYQRVALITSANSSWKAPDETFYIGSDGAIYSSPLDNSNSTFALTAPGVGQPNGGIAVVFRAQNAIDLAWVNNNGAIETQEKYAGTWQQPFLATGLGVARPGASVAIASRTVNSYDIFWVGNDGAIWSTWWDSDNGARWSAPFTISPPNSAYSDAGLSASAKSDRNVDVAWEDTRGNIEYAAWNVSWRAPYSIGRITWISPVSIVSLQSNPNFMLVMYLGSRGELYGIPWNIFGDGQWGFLNGFYDNNHQRLGVHPNFGFAAVLTASDSGGGRVRIVWANQGGFQSSDYFYSRPGSQ